MLLETFLIYHIPPNIRASKIAHLNKKVWATQLSKMPEMPLPKSTSCHGQLIIFFWFSVLFVLLIFTQILSESLKLMVYGVTNTLGIVNEYKWEIPQTSLAHGRPHPHLLPLSILSLLQTGIETVSPTTTGGLYNCLLKAFVPALLVGLIPPGEGYLAIKCAWWA